MFSKSKKPVYNKAWYVRPTIHLLFLNGKETEVTPQTFSLAFDDPMFHDWKWWLREGLIVNRYPLAAIQEVTVSHWERLPILYTGSDLEMMRYDFLTLEEIEEKISKNIFKKA